MAYSTHGSLLHVLSTFWTLPAPCHFYLPSCVHAVPLLLFILGSTQFLHPIPRKREEKFGQRKYFKRVPLITGDGAGSACYSFWEWHLLGANAFWGMSAYQDILQFKFGTPFGLARLKLPLLLICGLKYWSKKRTFPVSHPPSTPESRLASIQALRVLGPDLSASVQPASARSSRPRLCFLLSSWFRLRERPLRLGTAALTLGQSPWRYKGTSLYPRNGSTPDGLVFTHLPWILAEADISDHRGMVQH